MSVQVLINSLKIEENPALLFLIIYKSLGDLLSLKQFVNETLKLEGQWSQPGGEKKVFTSGTNTISWRKKRKDLQFKGTDAD